jgi:hypothetical protein
VIFLTSSTFRRSKGHGTTPQEVVPFLNSASLSGVIILRAEETPGPYRKCAGFVQPRETTNRAPPGHLRKGDLYEAASCLRGTRGSYGVCLGL